MGNIDVSDPSYKSLTLEEEEYALGLSDALSGGVQTVETVREVEKVQVVYRPAEARKPVDAEFVKPDCWDYLLYSLTASRRKGAMLFGRRGTGKSTLIRQLAKTVGAEWRTLQCASNMQFTDLLGQYTLEKDTETGATVSRFVEGWLAECVRNGYWAIAEEANVIQPGVWSMVNTLTDHTGEPLRLPTGELVKPHPDFRLIILYNEGSAYSGTRDVNAALKRRLTPVHLDYPPFDQEVKIVQGMTQARTQDVENLIRLAQSIRGSSLDFDLSSDILAEMLNATLFGTFKAWEDAFRCVVMDMLGDPSCTQPERAVMAQLATVGGMSSWPLPEYMTVTTDSFDEAFPPEDETPLVATDFEDEEVA